MRLAIFKIISRATGRNCQGYLFGCIIKSPLLSSNWGLQFKHNYVNMVSSTSMKNKNLPKILLITATTALVVGIIITILELSNVIDVFGKSQNPSGSSQSSSQGTGDGGADPVDENAAEPNGENEKRPVGSPATPTNVAAPKGDFVSNHEPNLDSNPAPNSLQSVCITSVGASCTVTFTKDGVTKSLPPQNTDKEGAAYWSWTLQEIGLSEGEWTIEARAGSGEQTKTTKDPLALRVGP